MGTNKGKQAESEATFAARILIMLYGLGIVLIGAYPIQQEYGSVSKFLRLKANAVLAKAERYTAGSITLSDYLPSLESSSTTPRVREDERRFSRESEYARARPKVVTPAAPIDELTATDREELDIFLDQTTPK